MKTEPEDETAITEITIQPDGRIYVFGLSLEVAEVLSGLCPAGHAIEKLIAMIEKPACEKQTEVKTPNP